MGKNPVIVNDEVSLYGIDSLSKPSWEFNDFELEKSDKNYFSLLCMHQLFHPPVPEMLSDHCLEDLFSRLNIEIDALALGDYHEPESCRKDGVQVFYGGSTEKNSLKEGDPRTVTLLEIGSDDFKRRQIALNTRDFISFGIEFGESDSLNYVHEVVEGHEIDDKVVIITIKGNDNSLTSQDIKKIVMNAGATVCRVKDDRKKITLSDIEPVDGVIENIDSRVEKFLADKGISDVSQSLDEFVRGDDVADSNVREEAGRIIEERRDEIFGDTED